MRLLSPQSGERFLFNINGHGEAIFAELSRGLFRAKRSHLCKEEIDYMKVLHLPLYLAVKEAK